MLEICSLIFSSIMAFLYFGATEDIRSIQPLNHCIHLPTYSEPEEYSSIAEMENLLIQPGAVDVTAQWRALLMFGLCTNLALVVYSYVKIVLACKQSVSYMESMTMAGCILTVL